MVSILYLASLLSILFLFTQLEEDEGEKKKKKRKFIGPQFSIGVISAEMPFAWFSMADVEDELDVDKEVFIPEDRYSTGTNDFDRILKGGLLKSHSILLKTPSCDEKDMILYNIIKKVISQKGIIFAAERMRPYLDGFLDQENFFMTMCGQDSSKRSEKVITCDMGPTSVNLAIARSLMKIKPKEKILIFNILSQLILQDNAGSVSQFLQALMSKARSKNISVIAILNPKMHESEDIAQLDDIFDAHIEILSREIEKDGVLKVKKFLVIKKMPNVDYIDGLHEIKIKEKKLRIGES